MKKKMKMMMMKERRDIKPLLVKFGVALALYFAGFLYSRIRTKRIKPPDSPSSISGSDKTADYDRRLGVKDDSQPETDSDDAFDKECIRVRVDSPSIYASPNGRYSGDRDGYLLPEFDQVVKEFDIANMPKTDLESFIVEDLPKSRRRIERDDYEQEIKNLKKRINFLLERERKLEVQLLEYYGLKEQEKTVMELHNRLKINSMEAKIFLMKIENLKAENKRLEAQVGDYSEVVSELEAAKEKIKLLKRKIRYETQHNKEQISDLAHRVMKLQEQEHDHEASTSNPGDPSELQRLAELEAEAEDLRKSNEILQRDNADLARRLESTQVLANSLFEDPEQMMIQEEELHKAMIQLREENEELKNEVERLRVDGCGEVEELVYLRWINACLRYELRNYRPPPGKTVARDLSKCLSPTSEQKAKQLILEYANTNDGADKEPPSHIDFDYDQWPSSHPSYLTDSTDHEEYADPSSSHKPHSKNKFFAALRKIVRGLSIHHNHNQSSRASPIYRSLSFDDMGRRYHEVGHNRSRSNPQSPKLASSSQNSNNSSLDFHRLESLAEEDDNASRMKKARSASFGGVSLALGRECVGDSLFDYVPEQDSVDGQISDLAKYAEVFKDSRRLQKHKKSASYSAR